MLKTLLIVMANLLSAGEAILFIRKSTLIRLPRRFRSSQGLQDGSFSPTC